MLNNAEEDGGRKKPVRKDILELPEEATFMVDNPDRANGRAKVPMVVKGLGIKHISLTPKGLPSVDISALR